MDQLIIIQLLLTGTVGKEDLFGASCMYTNIWGGIDYGTEQLGLCTMLLVKLRLAFTVYRVLVYAVELYLLP